MLDMGFRPAVDRIVRACPKKRQTLFFSATLEGEAGTTAQRYTTDAVRHEHGPAAGRAVAEVDHRFVRVSTDGRIDALVAELAAERELALVFVRTKHGADRLVKRLSAQGVNALAMHGNKSQRQREVALARFESGAVDTLVATDVAARGIDVTGISHVINFDPPHDHETYVHRVGRTGRAGRTGSAITLVAGHERRELGLMADRLGIEHDLGPAGPAGPAGSDGQQARPRPAGGGKPRNGHHQQRPAGAGRSDGGRGRRRRGRPGQSEGGYTPRPKSAPRSGSRS
jgi:ATP-dependent RNA helicase RhlE